MKSFLFRTDIYDKIIHNFRNICYWQCRYHVQVYVFLQWKHAGKTEKGQNAEWELLIISQQIRILPQD